jgi:transposase-like protein
MATTEKAGKKLRKARKIYPAKRRAAILAEAKTKGLTGNDVAKKYGISMMTYYNWRKKAGAVVGHAGKRVAATTSRSGSTGEMRRVIKERVRLVAPAILRDEVMAYLAESLGAATSRRGGRR